MKKLKQLLLNIYAFLLPIICGILGAIGGAENKGARRILIPLLITSLAYGQTESIFVITIMSMCAWLSMGYGIPGTGDNGSFLGRFYYNLFHQNHLLADIFTRGSIGVLIALSLISIPIIKKNYIVYILCSLCIILTNALISWRGFGTYYLFGKELSWVETITWGLITLFATLIIKIK
jgi:hypothetical protein